MNRYSEAVCSTKCNHAWLSEHNQTEVNRVTLLMFIHRIRFVTIAMCPDTHFYDLRLQIFVSYIINDNKILSIVDSYVKSHAG